MVCLKEVPKDGERGGFKLTQRAKFCLENKYSEIDER